jgi:virulence factor Mce-like protein
VTRRGRQEPFRNPILIGAITILILVVAVYLAYNANNGLPFVPTYNLNVEVPNASGLIASDSVLIGGTRVGYVGSISAAKTSDGTLYAVVHVKLDKSIEPLPADSTDLVRPVSPLGLEYLQIERGHSKQTLGPGATVPMTQTQLPVQVDDIFKMFTARTRAASKENLNEFGDGFASRGSDLNDALSQLQPLVGHLLAVTTNLNASQTRFARLFPSLEQAANEVAPVAGPDAQLFVGLDETFTPLSNATQALQAAIAGGPAALKTGTQELPAQAQFIDDTSELFRRFHPAFVNLASASVQLAPAIAAGIPAVKRAPQLDNRLVATLDAVERFAADSRTVPGLILLTQTATSLEPTLAFIKPAQTTCNYLALFFRNLESALSESDVVGSFLRIGILALPQLPNSEAGPSSAAANGPPASAIPGLTGSTRTLVDDSFLHSNPYPNTDAPGQTPECEAGNEHYIPGRQVIGNDPGNQGLVTETTKRSIK